LRIVSKERDSAEQARNRPTLAIGYAIRNPAFIFFRGFRYDAVVGVWVLRLFDGMFRRHAAVKPRPRDRVKDRQAPFDFAISLSTTLHVFTNVIPRPFEGTSAHVNKPIIMAWQTPTVTIVS
jgi:hypothetical protein